MLDDKDLGNKVKVGHEVQSVLTNVHYQNAFKAIELGLFEQFKSCPTGAANPDGLLELQRRLMAVNWLKDEFQTMIEDGTMAARELEARSKNH